MHSALCILLLAAAGAHAAAGTAALYVAANGSDRWSGTLEKPNAGKTDGPFATLTRARDAVRAVRKAQPENDVVVLLRGGTYRIAQAIEFTPADSGRPGGSVTYAAYPGEKPVVSGGRPIRGFQRAEGGLWRARVPEAGQGKWRFEQLYVNGRRAVRARTPNRGYLYMAGTIATGVDPTTGKAGPLDDHAFIARRRDIAPLLALPAERLGDPVVSVYHSWEISRHHVTAIDAGRNLVFLTGRYPPKFNHYVTHERYLLENYREALDAPGEWFLDADGTLLYKPRPGENMATAEVVAPVPEVLLRLAGDRPAAPAGTPAGAAGGEKPATPAGAPAGQKPAGPTAAGDTPGRHVENLVFRGLTFRYAGYNLPADGQWSPQAACNIGAAIEADYARGVRFVDCEVEHTGTYALWFRDGCRDCSVERCYLGDLGAGGVRLGQTAVLPKPEQATSHIRVDNNILRGGGRLWPDCVGILLGHSGDNQVTHNDISLLPYTGISAGWRWGYGDVPSKRNIISYNHIHHLGWDVLADMGGIYTLGEAPGTVLGNNVIHDIDGDGDSGMHGLYNDNSTSNMLLENNLVYRVRDGGYQLGSGKGNILRNNVFIADPRNHSVHGQILFCMYYPTETHVAATFEKNILYGSGGKLFSVPDFGGRLEFRNNLYCEPSGAPLDFAGKPFDEWRKLGRDAGSLVADPKFVDPARGDFRLRPDSPALRLGFVPFDPKKAGVYGDPAWVARAGGVSLPPWQNLPGPPPATFADDFEETAVGALPSRTGSMVEGKGDVLAVTEETAAGGKRSLKLGDVPGLKYSFNPHFWYSPSHTAGVSTFSLDLRLDAGAELDLQWRQYPGKPYYYVGPRAIFRDGKLFLGDQAVIDLPPAVWFHVEISAGFGPDGDGTWTLATTLPGSPAKRFPGLKFESPETRSVTWIGFISSGSKPSAYYVDNVRLRNSKAEE